MVNMTKRLPGGLRISLLFLASLIISFVLAANRTPIVSAHASLVSSVPAKGSIIGGLPGVLTAEFAEETDPGKSKITVKGPQGQADLGNSQVNPNNAKEMTVGLKFAGYGVYTVKWNTASVQDGDPDQGSFTFTVAKGAPPVSALPATGRPLFGSTVPALSYLLLFVGVIFLQVTLRNRLSRRT